MPAGAVLLLLMPWNFEQHALSGVTAQDPRTEEALHGNLWIMC